MINVVPAVSGGLDGLHCTAYPSPSALEACSICEDKFRMEQLTKGCNGGEYESSADAERGTVIHKACAVLLSLLCRKENGHITQLSLYEKSVDSLSKIASWDNSYWDLAYKTVLAGNIVIKMRERGHDD